jgi:hypothetical protein
MPRHVIRYDYAGRPSCDPCGWSSEATGEPAIEATLAHVGAPDITIRSQPSHIRPDSDTPGRP